MTNTPDTTAKSKTARHFEAGARVFHKEYGYGVVMVSDHRGEHYPKFEGATGTPYTRVWAAPADAER